MRKYFMDKLGFDDFEQLEEYFEKMDDEADNDDDDDFDAETFDPLTVEEIEVMAQVPPPVCFEEKIPPSVWENTSIQAQEEYAETGNESVLLCPQCGISKADLREQGGYCGTTDPESEEYISTRSCPYEKYFSPQHWIDEPQVISHITPEKIVLEDTLTTEMDMPPIDPLPAGIETRFIPNKMFYQINQFLPKGVVSKQSLDGQSYELTYYSYDTDAVEKVIDTQAEQEGDMMFGAEIFNTYGSRLCDEDCGEYVDNDYNTTCDACLEEVASYGAESNKKPSKTAERAILTGASTGATMEIADALLAAETFGAEGFEAEQVGGFLVGDGLTAVMVHLTGLNSTPVGFDEVEGKEIRKLDEESQKELMSRIMKRAKKRRSKRGQEEANRMMEIIKDNDFTFVASYGFEAETYLEGDYDYSKIDSLWDKWISGELSDDEAEILIPMLYYSERDDDGKKAVDVIQWVEDENNQASSQMKDLVRDYFSSEEFNVEFDDWADQEMLTHGENVSFKEWAKEEGKKHGDMDLTDWAEEEEESHDERYGAEEGAFYQLEVKYNMEDGWEHYGDYNDKQDAINAYYDIYLEYPEVKLVEVDYEDGYVADEIYSQRNFNLDAETFESQSAQTKVKPPVKSIGILLGLGAMAAVFAPESLKKLFNK